MQHQGFIRAPLAALMVIAAMVFPAAAESAPEDQPAVQQYADPFGPLPTGERAGDFDPLSAEFGMPPARLLRQLTQVDVSDRGSLAALVTQVGSANRRVRVAAGPETGSAPPLTERASHVLDAPAASFFDLGGPGPWIIVAAAALAAVAALRARAFHRR